jgi:serine/threonine protein kinase
LVVSYFQESYHARWRTTMNENNHEDSKAQRLLVFLRVAQSLRRCLGGELFSEESPMKECGLCQRTRMDDNLWCQEKHCPAEIAPLRLRVGDRLGEIEIVQWITTLPAATLYKAQRGKTVLLLKVAHPGYEDKLKREALFLQSHPHPVLPQLLPAHSGASLEQYPYGKIAARGQIVTFTASAFVEGQLLRELLERDAQPWYLTTGWIVASLADALAFLHDDGLFHLCLSPEIILVRFDRQGAPRPLLADLGVACAFEDIPRHWRPQYVPLPYAAPEVGRQEAVGAAADVYGLGCLLFEMLAGRPMAIGATQQATAFAGMAATGDLFINRADLQVFPELARRATQPDWRERPADVLEFAQELLSSLPPVPRENKERAFRAEAMKIIIFVVLLVAFLITMVAILD